MTKDDVLQHLVTHHFDALLANDIGHTTDAEAIELPSDFMVAE
jgi:hypothetical protein